MLLNVILDLIYYVLAGIVAIYIVVFPDVSADSNVSTAITNITHYIATWNDFLPLTTIFTILALIIAIELIIAGYKLAMWIIRRFPTQS